MGGGGGYTAYQTYNVGPDVPPIEIEDNRGFAVKYMTLNRFRQIRGAFHPENKDVVAAGGGGGSATNYGLCCIR